MNISTALGRLRILAILEGISYLLLGITMPLKYQLGMTAPNFYVGMAHGWLFVLYILIGFQVIYLYKFSFKTGFLILVASLVPVGTFLVDYKILKPLEVKKRTKYVK